MKDCLKCSLHCLLGLTGMASLSDAAIAREALPSNGIYSALPTLTFGKPRAVLPLFPVGLPPETPRPAMPAPPFGNRGAGSIDARSYGYRLDLGVATLGIEGSRLQKRAADWMSRLDTGRDRQKSWSLGARSDLAAGGEDRLSLEAAAGSDHSLQSRMPVADPHVTTSSETLGLAWLHGGHWLTSVGWQRTGGAAKGAIDRMIELANGAPLHEKGLRLLLSFLPGGASDPHGTSLGIEGRRAALSPDDLAAVGPDRGKDMRLGLFARTRF